MSVRYPFYIKVGSEQVTIRNRIVYTTILVTDPEVTKTMFGLPDQILNMIHDKKSEEVDSIDKILDKTPKRTAEYHELVKKRDAAAVAVNLSAIVLDHRIEKEAMEAVRHSREQHEQLIQELSRLPISEILHEEEPEDPIAPMRSVSKEVSCSADPC